LDRRNFNSLDINIFIVTKVKNKEEIFMENASKALIIAGAILLSILIISLGIFIFQMAKNSTEGINLDPQKISAYNDPFENYEGTTVSGAQVKAMIDTVRSHNNANKADPSKMVELIPDSKDVSDKEATFDQDPNTTKTATGGTGNGGYATLKSAVKTGQQYTVVCGHDPSTGYVTTISYATNAGNKPS